MQFVHLDGGVKAEMEEFYQANGDKPFEHSGITEKAKGKIPGSGKETYLYIVRTKEVPSGFAVSIEETDKGFKIDWRGFVQFGHGLLENFADDPNAEAQKFYAVAKRSHYFGSSVPNAENMLCVRVISPVNTEKEIYAFASEGSLAGEEIKEQLRWGRTYRPVLWLEWTGSGEQRYIRIKSVERLSWREAS